MGLKKIVGPMVSSLSTRWSAAMAAIATVAIASNHAAISTTTVATTATAAATATASTHHLRATSTCVL